VTAVGEAILVTGATGPVGGEVVRLLAARGRPVRAGSRRREAEAGAAGAARDAVGPSGWGGAGGTAPGDVERVRFDFRDRSTYPAAFRGVGQVFLLRPRRPVDVRRDVRPFLEAALRAGVEHVVFLSLLGAERNPLLPHSRIERLIRRSGMPYTFLRANAIMQTLSDFHREDIRERGEIFVPAGRGRTSFVDARDVAAVAVAALTEAGHLNRAYPLTGGEALDYYQVARTLTEVVSRPVFYRAPSTARFVAVMLRRGHRFAEVAALVALYTFARLGLAATVTGDTAGVLHRPPVTLQRFIEDYQDRWR
jgi:uncharacterized protein YbjT (DUF2867 family)